MKKYFIFILSFVLVVSMIYASIDDLFSDEAFFRVEEQIVVSASRRAQKLSDAPLSVAVITADDIKNSGVQSIAEALRMAPGVYVQETTGGQQDVAIRGMINSPKEAGGFSVYSRNILVMIDGRSYFNDVFGGTFWEMLPITIDDIERIEVVRGPSSALFGANAVTGVVNIITKDMSRTDGAVANVSYGSNGNQLHSVRYGTSGEKLSYRVGFEYTTKEIFDDKSYNHTYDRFESNRASLLAGEGFPLNPDFPAADDKSLDIYRLSSFLNYSIDQNSNLSFQYGSSAGSMNVAGVSGDLMLNNYAHLENNVLRMNYNWKDLSVSVSNVYGQMGDEINYKKPNDTAPDHPNQDGLSWDSLDIDVQKLFYLGDRNILMAGLNWREIKSYGSGVYFRDEVQKKQQFTAAFFNNEFTINDQLKWILGGRYDKYDTPDKAEFSPQSIIFYRPIENHTFRFIYSESIRSPFIADLFTNAQFSTAGTLVNPDGLAPIIRLQPNEDLDPMRIKSTEITYSTLLKDRINLDMSIYRYEVNDLIGYDNIQWDSMLFAGDIYMRGTAIPLNADVSSAMDLKAVNLDGKLKSTGLELGMTYNLDADWKLWGNYAYQNTKFQNSTLKSSPAHLASIGSYKNYSTGWNMSFSLNFVSSSEVEVTNIMDQTLAQINKDLTEDMGKFFEDAFTGADTNKAAYLQFAEDIYLGLGGNVLTTAQAEGFFTQLVTIGQMDAATKNTLMGLWNSPLSDAQASLFAAQAGIPLSSATGQSVSIKLPFAPGGVDQTFTDKQISDFTLRAVNGELYKMTSSKSSSQSVSEYIFINFRLARPMLNNNAEFAISGSIRPSIRQYAFGEKTGNSFRTSFSYKF